MMPVLHLLCSTFPSHGIGSFAKTFVWLVSPLYEGGELFDRIVSLSANGRPYTEVQAALIFEQLLAALNVCHQNGIAHRSINQSIKHLAVLIGACAPTFLGVRLYKIVPTSI